MARSGRGRRAGASSLRHLSGCEKRSGAHASALACTLEASVGLPQFVGEPVWPHGCTNGLGKNNEGPEARPKRCSRFRLVRGRRVIAMSRTPEDVRNVDERKGFCYLLALVGRLGAGASFHRDVRGAAPTGPAHLRKPHSELAVDASDSEDPCRRGCPLHVRLPRDQQARPGPGHLGRHRDSVGREARRPT